MTITIVYGDAADGYLSSNDASYATARTGPADVVSGGTVAWFGQNHNGGSITVLQAFVRFAYPSLAAGEVVTSAVVQLSHSTNLSSNVSRDMEVRGFTWSGSGLTVADWRTPAQLAAATLYGRVTAVQSGTSGKVTLSGTEALRALIGTQDYFEAVVIDNRQRVGTVPAGSESSSFYTADQTGTTQDPCLVFGSIIDHRLVPILGAEAQLSDGSWVYLTDGSSLSLVRKDAAGTVTAIGSVPLGTGAGQWASVPGGQGVTLTVDASDNVYVVGRAGEAGNSVRVQAWNKGAGWTWTAGTIRTAALGAHDSPINNVVATWHSTAGGTLVVFAAHAPGDGVAGGAGGDIGHLLWNTTYLRTGTGSAAYSTGYSIAAGLVPAAVGALDYSGYANETGTGMDVCADHFQADWGYVASFDRGQRLGGNAPIGIGRYQLNTTGTGFAHTSHERIPWARKDPGAKVRVLSIGSGQIAVATTDADAGYGLTVTALQSNGLTPGWVTLGASSLAAESIATMPDGPAVAGTAAWDAVYSATENAVWVYHADVANSARLVRTSVSMDTYQATRTIVQVSAGVGGTIRAIRVPRNAWVASRSHVSVAYVTGGVESATYLVDTLNLPPLAPTLTPRTNFDATADATFAWAFADPNAGDTQSAYQLQIERVDTGASVVDTGKVVSTVSSRSVVAGTLTNGLSYRWRVTTWDALDTAGVWSGWGTFSTNAGGTVTITSPAVDNPAGVITDTLQVTWSVSGTVQVKVRIWTVRNDTGATVHDSGWFTTSNTTGNVSGMTSDVEHTIRVQVENASLVKSGIGARLVTPSYGSPEVPVVTVTPTPDDGYVLVSVTNPPPAGDRPDVVRNRILRRVAGTSGAWTVLGECEPDGTFRDYTVPSLVPVEYMVRGESA